MEVGGVKLVTYLQISLPRDFQASGLKVRVHSKRAAASYVPRVGSHHPIGAFDCFCSCATKNGPFSTRKAANAPPQGAGVF